MSSVSKSSNDIIEEYRTEFPDGTPFVCACEKGRVEDVEGMIRGARAAGMDVTAMVSELGTSSYGYSYTPLMIAALYEHSTIIEILLQCNADTATTDNGGWNALHYAAYNNKTTTTTVQLLLNNMKLEDINHKTTSGFTPLDVCYDNNSSIRQQLIDLIRQKGGKRASELNSVGSSGSMSRNNVQDIWVLSSEEERSSDSEDEDGDNNNNNNNNNPKIKKAKKKSKKRKTDENAKFQENKDCPICMQPLMGTKQALKYDDSIYAIQDDNVDEILILNCCGYGIHKRCIERSLNLEPFEDNYFGRIIPARNGCPVCTKQPSLRKPKVLKSSNIEVKTVTNIGFQQTLKF